MAISDELSKLIQTKNNLKNAITDKGQEITNEDAFSIYSEKIEAIETKSEVPVIATPDDENPTVIEQNPEAPAQVSTDDTKESINVVVTPQTETLLGEGSKMEVKVPATSIATAIELNSEQIKADEIVLGVSGKESVVDTSDATAAADDIIRNKTAYVNGEKVTGTILDSSGRLLDAAIQVSTKSLHHEQFDIEFSTSYAGGDRVIRDFDDIILGATNEQVANAINLTADKITTGNAILGIAGTAETLPENTYTIDTSASYSSDSINVTGTELQLTNIQDNNELWKQGAKYTIYAQLSDVASKLGITANKIVQGNTIAGVQGTASTILTEEFTKEQYAYMNGKTVVEYPDSLLLKSISMLDGSSITLTEAKLLSVVLLGDGITNESTKLDTVFTLAIKLNSSDLSKLSNKTFMLKAVFTPAEFDIGTININETSDIQYITVNTSIRLTSLLNEVDRYKIVEVDS